MGPFPVSGGISICDSPLCLSTNKSIISNFPFFLNYVMLNKKGFSPFQNCKIELSLLNWADLFFRVIVCRDGI